MRKLRQNRQGIAMVQVLIVIMLMLLLTSALLSASAAAHRRISGRSYQNKARYCAILSAKMLADRVTADPSSPEAQAILGYRDGAAHGMPETQLELLSGEGYDKTEAEVTAKSEFTLGSDGGEYLTITATAVSGGKRESVQITLQRRSPEYTPSTPFGAGVKGALVLEGNSTLSAGADTDLFLTGYESLAGESLPLGNLSRPDGAARLLFTTAPGQLTVGGNLILQGVDGSFQGLSVGGMVLGDDADLLLTGCAIGPDSSETPGALGRLTGVFADSRLGIVGGRIRGQVWARQLSTAGDLTIQEGDLNYLVNENPPDAEVYDWKGELIDPPLRLGSVVRFDGGRGWKELSDSTVFADYSVSPDTFLPNWPQRVREMTFSAFSSRLEDQIMEYDPSISWVDAHKMVNNEMPLVVPEGREVLHYTLDQGGSAPAVIGSILGDLEKCPGVILHVGAGETLSLCGSIPGAGADQKQPVVAILLEDESSALELWSPAGEGDARPSGGDYAVCVYGKGTVNVRSPRVTVTGTLQAGKIILCDEVFSGLDMSYTPTFSPGDTHLTVRHVEPYPRAFRTPASAGLSSESWVALNYDEPRTVTP